MAYAFELQPWITVRGEGSGTTVIQPDSSYLDVSMIQDAVLYLDVSDFSGGAKYDIETSPTKDNTLFQALFTSRTPSSSGLQALEIIRFASATVPIARYLRWKCSGTSAWSITFRIWVSGIPVAG